MLFRNNQTMGQVNVTDGARLFVNIEDFIPVKTSQPANMLDFSCTLICLDDNILALFPQQNSRVTSATQLDFSCMLIFIFFHNFL